MIREYWIIWGYSNIPGHVQSSTRHDSEKERQEAIKNPHRNDIFVSNLFECDEKGNVI
jgi:hypothetical protein